MRLPFPDMLDFRPWHTIRYREEDRKGSFWGSILERGGSEVYKGPHCFGSLQAVYVPGIIHRANTYQQLRAAMGKIAFAQLDKEDTAESVLAVLSEVAQEALKDSKRPA